MKKSEKIVISILIIIVVVMIIIWIVGSNKKEENNNSAVQTSSNEEYVSVLNNETKVNVSSKLAEVKETGGYKFENMQLTTKDNQTVLLADVTNETQQAKDTTFVSITLIDEDGNDLVTVQGAIPALEAGAKTQFNTTMTLDYAKAYDFRIEINK